MAIWTIHAKRQLRHGLAERLCEHAHEDGGRASCLEPIESTMQQLDEILENTFPDSENIIVLDEFAGFRRKDQRRVLLVEVNQRNQGGPYVVKVGPQGKLTAEVQGWNCCRPVGLRHDLVLLPLIEGFRPKSDGESEWMSLIYGDAQQFIGVERTVAFEEAFINSVRYGNPTISSIAFVLNELFERLGHLLYPTSFVEDPADAGYTLRIPKVMQGIDAWKTNEFHRSIRTDTNVLVNHGVTRFIDPVDYFEQWIIPHFAYEKLGADGKLETVPRADGLPNGALAPREDGAREERMLIQPRPEDLVPYMLRGCAHGDLHGRNILVGVVSERALWPTVFDYEDMGACNLVGWDFVKLETELKIRAFSLVMSRTETQFISQVRDFEIELNALTEQFYLDGSWPLVQEDEGPLSRLRAALLELRRMAARHLGQNRGRAKHWLEEYYFLLTAYGINTANYGNLERREVIASYVAAGVAAARLSWPRKREVAEREMLGI
ncbi:hypothetical protein OAS39_09255 [Pirellulales bacterium]|nr:hypothetical protein [Pirellulales bacterium]